MASPILVWGAGAIGGTLGAHWVRAGHEVVLVDIAEEHVERIRDGRLTIDGPVARFTVGARAYTPDELTGTYELVFLAVKSHHTRAAIEALRPHLADDGAVVSCQNGLNELLIADLIGAERTIGAFVNLPADWIGPGHITYGRQGALVVGELDGRRTPRIERIGKLATDFSPRSEISPQILADLWGKMAFYSLLTASALSNAPLVEFLTDARVRPVLVALVREMVAVANRDGVEPKGFKSFDPQAFVHGDPDLVRQSLENYAAGNRGSTKQHSGIWRDLAVRRRQTEVEAIYAPVLDKAAAHDIPMATTRHLIALIRAIEVGRRQIGPALVDEIVASAATDILSPVI